jgi:hypothetical protein
MLDSSAARLQHGFPRRVLLPNSLFLFIPPTRRVHFDPIFVKNTLQVQRGLLQIASQAFQASYIGIFIFRAVDPGRSGREVYAMQAFGV